MSPQHDFLVAATAAIPVLYLPVLFEYAKHGAARLADAPGRHQAVSLERDPTMWVPFGDGPLTLILYGMAFAWGELFTADGVLRGDKPGIVPLVAALTSMLLGVALGLAGFIEVQLGRLTKLHGSGQRKSFLRGVVSGGLTGLIVLPPGLRLAGTVSTGTSVTGYFGKFTFIAATIVFALLAGCRAAGAAWWRWRAIKRNSKKQHHENAGNDPDPHPGPLPAAPAEDRAAAAESSCRETVAAQ